RTLHAALPIWRLYARRRRYARRRGQEVNIMNIKRDIVNSTTSNLLWQRHLAAVVTALLLTLVLIFVSRAGAQTNPTPRSKAFGTPQDGANSHIDAAEKYDEAALTDIRS